MVEVIEELGNGKYTGRKLGKTGQIEVLQLVRIDRCKKPVYRVYCSVCAKDPELYGDGVFFICAINIRSGYIPCGCSKQIKRTEEQYLTLIKRSLYDLPYKFIGYKGEYIRGETMCILECSAHGTWERRILSIITRSSAMCPVCSCLLKGAGHRKEDDEFINSFRSTLAYNPDTEFIRSTRSNKNGARPWWWVRCADCGETTESLTCVLNKGGKSCYCGRRKPNFAYISTVSSDGVILGLKFGITSRPKHRSEEQNKRSIYEIETIKLYKFDNHTDCRKAEDQIIKKMVCGIFTAEELPDGYTETTYTYNLDRIVEIYEKHGGFIYE